MPFGDCVLSAAFVKDVGAGQCFGSRRCHPMEVLFHYDSMVYVAGGLCLGVCCFFGFIGRCAFMLSCYIYNIGVGGDST